MTEAGQNLLETALKLSADERAVLAANLWARAEEVRQRLRRIESGEDQPVPWEAIRGRLRAKFTG